MIKLICQKKLLYLPILLLFLFICLLTGCQHTDSIRIKDVKLEKVKDGTYKGEYAMIDQKLVFLTRNIKVQRPNILSWISALRTPVADVICDGKVFL